MLHSIHSSPLTPIKTIEVSYGCYWIGHSSYGPISSSWSLTECVWPDCEEVFVSRSTIGMGCLEPFQGRMRRWH